MQGRKRIKGLDEGTDERVLDIVLPTKTVRFLSVLVPANLSSCTSLAINKMITFVSLLTGIHRVSLILIFKHEAG